MQSFFNNSFGWIDFSKKDKKNAISVISANSQEILDELGLGIIRDAFSNYFFPGITTAQTRAKYFLLVPYILHEFSLKPVKEKSIEQFYNYSESTLKATEKDTANLILNYYKQRKISVENLQIIGTVTLQQGKFVTNVPRTIYWNGLNTFGIISYKEKNNITVPFYDYLDAIWYGDNKNKPKDDSDEKSSTNQTYFFLPDITKIYKENWRTNLNISLTKEEANYLKQKIISSTKKLYGSTLTVSNSLLANILKDDSIDINKINSIHELRELISVKKTVSSDIKERLKYADFFNEFYKLVMKRYNFILSGKKDELDYSDTDLKEIQSINENLDLNELNHLMFENAKKTKTLLSAINFMVKIKKLFSKITQAYNTGANIEKLLQELDKEIEMHELSIKHGKAKLIRKEINDSLNEKNVPILTYRLSHVRTIINDIREAIND